MSAENVELAREFMSRASLDDLATAMKDPDRVAGIGEALEPLVDPEMEVVTVGPEYVGSGTEYHGLDGFRSFWVDWVGPWETFSIEAEGYLDAGDKVVMLARQVGRLAAGGATVENSGAAVMTFRGGKMTRIEFHLDRDRAMRAAGLPPTSP